jgi:hypothetical protein
VAREENTDIAGHLKVHQLLPERLRLPQHKLLPGVYPLDGEQNVVEEQWGFHYLLGLIPQNMLPKTQMLLH